MICLLLLAPAGAAEARVQGYPYLDNETLGMFNILRDALDAPVQSFPSRYWGDPGLEQAFGGMLGLTRYLIAGTAYATAAVAERSPAYRAPYVAALRRAAEKMLHYRAWQDWMTHYGSDPLARDNLMFKGFLFYIMALYQRTAGDSRYETPVTLRYTDGKTFTTSIKVLADRLSHEASKAVDGQGQHHHGIACEPGQVFVICNTQHRVGYLVYDRLNKTSYSSATNQWLSWIRTHMVDPQSGMFYFMYRPDKPVGQQYNKSLSGLYNSITIIFIDALDEKWAATLYPRFKKHFVKVDGDSPHGSGTAVAYDYPTKQSSITTFALNAATTGVSMILARTMGDETLYKKLLATWERDFGKGAWEPDNSRFGYTFSSIVPLVFQNGVPLWARVTDTKYNVRNNALRTLPADRFSTPHITSVSNPKAFVNQAYYDSSKSRLIITINGGKATTAPATLQVARLDASKNYTVERNGEAHDQWVQQGGKLRFTTPPLSSTEESYTIFEAPSTQGAGQSAADDQASCSCAVRSPQGAWPILWGLLLLLGWARRSR